MAAVVFPLLVFTLFAQTANSRLLLDRDNAINEAFVGEPSEFVYI